MKRIFKRLAAIALVFALILSFSPSNAMAAQKKKYGIVHSSNSGYVSSILYGKAKPRKAHFVISTELQEDTTTDTVNDFIEYKTYKVTVTITRPTYSKKDIIGIRNNLRRIKAKGWNDFRIIIMDPDGDYPRGMTLTGGFNASASSKSQTLTAKEKKVSHNLYSYRKVEVYNYKILVTADHDPVYIGVAGLGNGQLTTANKNNYAEGRINFRQAGWGSSSKKGYAYVTRIN